MNSAMSLFAMCMKEPPCVSTLTAEEAEFQERAHVSHRPMISTV